MTRQQPATARPGERRFKDLLDRERLDEAYERGQAEAAAPQPAEAVAHQLEWELFKLPIAVDPQVRKDISAAIRAALANQAAPLPGGTGQQPAAEGLDVPDGGILAAIFEDTPPDILRSALGDSGEGLAGWVVGHWPEYARLAAAEQEEGEG